MHGYRSGGGWDPSADRSDEDEPLSRLWAFPALVVGALVTFAVHEFASNVRAEAAGICSAVLFGVMLSLWKYHRERWFWLFLLTAILAHGLAIWLVPWPIHHEFEKSDLTFVWLDYFLYLGAVMIIDHFVKPEKQA